MRLVRRCEEDFLGPVQALRCLDKNNNYYLTYLKIPTLRIGAITGKPNHCAT